MSGGYWNNFEWLYLCTRLSNLEILLTTNQSIWGIWFGISSASIHGLMPLKLHEVAFAAYWLFLRFLTHIWNFLTFLGVSWQNMASDEEHWFITPLFKLNCPLFESCFISFCNEISNCHSLGHTVVAVLQNLVKNSFHPKLMKQWSYHDVLYVKQNPPHWWLSG